MALHAFVAMPFGTKEGIDFNKVYKDYILVYVDRAFRYHIKDGVPDPATLEDAKKALSTFATETIQSWHGRKISPVYHLLPYLQEPDWKSLRVEEAKEFWEAYDGWARRIEVARRKNLPGDILVFTKEAPSRLLQPEARRKASKSLRRLGALSLAAIATATLRWPISTLETSL